MRKRQLIAQLLKWGGVHHLLNAYWGSDRLTVLAYHRITDVHAPDFVGFAPNVSATKEIFAEQIAHVARHFNVISLETLVDFIVNDKPLPPRSLLITFDDGYLDNYENAYPILKKHQLPAVIFLATSRMDDPRPLWWDNCAEAFRRTKKTSATLPHLMQQTFATAEEREAVGHRFIETIKAFSQSEKESSVLALLDVLEVAPIEEPLFMGWDKVRELVANGVACMPHTVNHPILTRIAVDEMRREIQDSRDKIIQETGQATIGFAYTNGMPGDYNQAVVQALRDFGYKTAFTLSAGPMRYASAKQHPFEIQRVFLSHRDTLEIFLMKIMGLPALTEKPQFIEAGK